MKASSIDILVRFGRAVRTKRLALDLTQESLAEKSELHRTYIADIERGTRNVSLRNIDRIALALDCSISTLFADIEKGTK